MKFSPRQQRTLAALLLSCALAPAHAPAQSRAPEARRQRDPASKPKGQARAAAKRLQRQREAVALLLETADAVRSAEDPDFRSDLQAMIADALWPFDEPSARALFRRAWESATEADRALREVIRANEPGADDEVEAGQRRTVLSLVAKHDPRLAEVFFQELARQLEAESEGQAEAGVNAAPPRRTPWRELSVSAAQRLYFAYDLMEDGDYKRAAAVAAPVAAEGASAELMDFILQLRALSPSDADALYLGLVERVRRDAASDANDVSLLSSVVVSPRLLVTVDELGSPGFRNVYYPEGAKDAGASEVPTAVRRAFFRAAAEVLTRPLPTPAGAEARTAQAAANYFVIGRLLPFFEREAARHVPGLTARQAALAGEVAEGSRERLASQMQLRSLTPANAPDPLRHDMEVLAGASDARARDRARLSGVSTAAQRKLWDRARGLAADIEDAETRRAAHTVIAVYQIIRTAKSYDDETDEFERAVVFVREADVPDAARLVGLAQAADLAARRGRRERAAELLDEAASLTGQLAPSTEDRLAAFALLTLTASRFDAARAWALLSSVVQAANDFDEYDGGDLKLGVTTSLPDGTLTINALQDEQLRLEVVFAAMARHDFARAAAEARSLRGAVPRALAAVAVARSALERKEAGGGQKPART